MAIEVVPGVYGISMTFVQAYLIADDGLTLVDSGLPRQGLKKITAEMERLGRKAGDLKHIVVTHYHVDHAGSLAALRQASGATVYMHPEDAPYIRGDKPLPGPNPAGLAGRLLAPFFLRLFGRGLEASAVDREVADGEVLPIGEGLQVVHAPGHTPGHIAVLMPSKKVLFVGDALANTFGLRPPVGMFTVDMAQARESMRKLAQLEFEVACFGHGRVLKGQAQAAFRRFVEKLAR